MSTKSSKNRKKPYTPKGSTKTTSQGGATKRDVVNKPASPRASVNTKTNRETIDLEKIKAAEIKEHPTKPENAEPKKEVVNEPTGSKTLKEIPESKNTRMRHGLIALGIIGLTLVIGIIATLLGGPLDESYTKPPAYPPEWLFPVVWTVLYISIGIAAYIAFLCVGDGKKRKWDIAWYGIHLFFNLMWPLFYFTLNWLIFSCVWLAIVVATAIIITYRYYRANLASGIIFTIYTLWLLYALYLSLATTIINVA